MVDSAAGCSCGDRRLAAWIGILCARRVGTGGPSMLAFWEESTSTGRRGERYEFWSHRRSGDFYAVQLTAGEVSGAYGLFSAKSQAQRHVLTGTDFDLVIGAK